MNKSVFYCRTRERRRKLIQEYEISPLAHLKLLNGQKKLSAAGDVITDQYYCFTYKNRTNENDNGSFFCGLFVADDFLDILKLKPLPLFNPFISNTDTAIYKTIENVKNNNTWNTLAREAYIAINILIMVWNIVPYGKLEKILNEIVKYPNSEPYSWKIKEINRIIGFGNSKRTLTEMINELISMDERIKQYQFSGMIKVLEKENVKINI